MFELKKKTYGIKIGDNIYSYSQASLMESIDYLFFLQNNFDIIVFLKEIFGLKSDQNLIKDLEKSDLSKIIKNIEKTRYKGFFNNSDKSDNKSDNKSKTIPYNAYIVFLSKNLSTSVNSLLKDYTPEALQFLTDGVIYNLNEQTEEGRNKNRIIESAKKSGISKEQLKAFNKAKDNKN